MHTKTIEFQKNLFRSLILVLALVFLLAACERPLQNVVDEGSATPAAEPDPTEAGADVGEATEVAPVSDPTETTPEEATAEAPEPLEPETTATADAADESPRTGDDEESATDDETDTTGGEARATDDADSTDDEATAEPTDEDATPQPTAEPTPKPTAEATPQDAPAGGETGIERLHVVKAGENLYRIGLQYGISWTVLAEYNEIANPNSLVVGQEIRIPPQTAVGETGTPAPKVTHVVQPGETLFIISQQYGVSWPDIAAANNLTAPYTIHAGQTLTIPGGE